SIGGISGAHGGHGLAMRALRRTCGGAGLFYSSVGGPASAGTQRLLSTARNDRGALQPTRRKGKPETADGRGQQEPSLPTNCPSWMPTGGPSTTWRLARSISTTTRFSKNRSSASTSSRGSSATGGPRPG